MYCRNMIMRGLAKLFHVAGVTFMLADVATKGLLSKDSNPKIWIIHGQWMSTEDVHEEVPTIAPSTDDTIESSPPLESVPP